MEQIPVYLNEPLIIGQVYYLVQYYMLANQPFLAIYIANNQLKNKWNAENSHKFNIMDMTFDGVSVIIKGMSKNAESFDDLNFDQFFTNKYWWIMGVTDHRAYFLGEVEPEETAESILKEKETKKAIQNIATVVIIILIGITLFFMIPKILKKLKRK